MPRLVLPSRGMTTLLMLVALAGCRSRSESAMVAARTGVEGRVTGAATDARVCLVQVVNQYYLRVGAPRHCVNVTPSVAAYQIDDVSPGVYWVSASAEGLEPVYAWFGPPNRQTRQVILSTGRFVSNVDLHFTRPGVRVSGVVTDAGGAAVAGATVQSLATFSESGVDGKFELWVDPREHGIDVQARGYARSFQALVMSGVPVEITLEAEAVLSGRVVDIHGAPVADAAIVLDRNGLDRPEAISASDGSFEVGGLGGGNYQLLALAAGRYGSLPEPIAVAPGSTAPPVVIVVSHAPTITGRIQTQDGAACESGHIIVSRPSSKFFTVVAADDGTLSFTLPTGSYAFAARCAGYGVHGGMFQLIDHSQSLEWTVTRGLAIVGRLVDASGAPVVHTKIWAHPSGRWRNVDPVWTGPNGEFSIVGVGSGFYTVASQNPLFVERVVNVTDEDLDLGVLSIR